MGSCEYHTKCPKCGGDVCHITFTNGEQYVGCLNPTGCSYGWKIRWVEVDGKMTLTKDMEKAVFHSISISKFEPVIKSPESEG